MKREIYVIGMLTTQGLLFVKSADSTNGEIEIKASNYFEEAYITDDLEACKEFARDFEHEADFNVYKIKLEEVQE